MPRKKVFLCHSSSDKIFVDRLAFDLEKTNVGVWYDKWEIKVGDSLIDKIQEGLEENDYLSIMLSPESVASEWVKRELNSALMKEIKDKKVIVLPCMVLNCTIPPFLREKKYADFRNSYEDGFTGLLLAIYPESKEVVIRSKIFRVVQYLISGLTSTDSCGSNILNSYQLKKIYPYREQLKGYLGMDEKRLLFYSAVAFKSANPNTPDYINNYVPVWGLVDEVNDVIRSKWIIEGINHKVIDFMIQNYDWAITMNESIDIEVIKTAFEQSVELYKSEYYLYIIPENTKRCMLKLFAKRDAKYFIDDYAKKQSNDPLVIEASSELQEPLETDYYCDLYRSEHGPNLAPSIIKTLVKLKRPEAIAILANHYVEYKPSWIHDVMNMLRGKEFIHALRAWFDKSKTVDEEIDIIGALGNCEEDITKELNAIISRDVKGKNIHSLIRIIGCYGNSSHAEYLLKKYSDKNPFITELITYAIGRLIRDRSIEYLIRWYETAESNIIKAAAIETIAQYDVNYVNEEIESISKYQDNPYMLAAIIRAIEISKSARWREILPKFYNHAFILVRLCAARSACAMADDDYTISILTGDYDELVKSVFDEKLYCREPFRPDWLTHPRNYDLELARLPIRLTWPDQPKVYFQEKLDMNRFLHRNVMMRQEY